LVKKKNGLWRTVLDYRNLNEQIVPDNHPLPLIEEILDNLKGAKYFTKLDLCDGFFNLILHPSVRKYTGFATRKGCFQWRVLPQGLRCSPSIFQRQMDLVLGDANRRFAVMYMDDCLVFSKTLEEHLQHLGHVISAEGVKPDPKKIEAITKMKTPENGDAVLRFVAMAGYHRRYIQNFSKRTYNLSWHSLIGTRDLL